METSQSIRNSEEYKRLNTKPRGRNDQIRFKQLTDRIQYLEKCEAMKSVPKQISVPVAIKPEIVDNGFIPMPNVLRIDIQQIKPDPPKINPEIKAEMDWEKFKQAHLNDEDPVITEQKIMPNDQNIAEIGVADDKEQSNIDKFAALAGEDNTHNAMNNSEKIDQEKNHLDFIVIEKIDQSTAVSVNEENPQKEEDFPKEEITISDQKAYHHPIASDGDEQDHWTDYLIDSIKE